MSADRRGSRGASRQAQAFLSLLEEDDQRPSPGSAPRSSGRRRSGGRERRARRPILLREEAEQRAAAAAAADSANSGGGALAQLLDVLGGSLPEDVVVDVLGACGGSAEAALEALLQMAGGEGGAAGGGPSSGAAPGRSLQLGTSNGSAKTAGGPPCYWEWLPEEIKQLVLGQLSVRDLARAAGTCAELAEHVRQQRRRLRSVTLPEGISMGAVRGAVAAFSQADAVSLARWAPRLQFPNQYEDMFAALETGEADRASGVPLRHIDLSRCGALTNGDVGTLCATLRHLDSLTLSRCGQLTDDCLGALARYTPDPAVSNPDLDLAAEELGELALESSSTERTPGKEAAGGGLPSPSTAVKRIAAAREAAQQATRSAAARSTAGLRQLRLRETGVTGRGLKALLQGAVPAARSLEVLDVSGCRGVGPEGFDLGSKCMLRTLRAAGCLQLRIVVIQLPPAAPLEELDLANCRQLQEVVLVAVQLRQLTLSHCGVLASLTLKCRSLEELRCINCTRLPGLGPEFECPALRHLDLFGCRALDAEGLEAGVASFGRLEHLNLGGCTLLSRLLLLEQAPRLAELNITGCGAVRQVVLGSRVLRSLSAKACARLVELRLYSQALAALDLENCAALRDVSLPTQATEAAAATSSSGIQEGALQLRGCAALTPAARQQLRAALRRC